MISAPSLRAGPADADWIRNELSPLSPHCRFMNKISIAIVLGHFGFTIQPLYVSRTMTMISIQTRILVVTTSIESCVHILKR